MNCKDLVLEKSLMPCIKLVVSEDASNSKTKDKLRQKISIQGDIEDEDEPSTIKVRIEISADTESKASLSRCAKRISIKSLLEKNGMTAQRHYKILRP